MAQGALSIIHSDTLSALVIIIAGMIVFGYYIKGTL